MSKLSTTLPATIYRPILNAYSDDPDFQNGIIFLDAIRNLRHPGVAKTTSLRSAITLPSLRLFKTPFILNSRRLGNVVAEQSEVRANARTSGHFKAQISDMIKHQALLPNVNREMFIYNMVESGLKSEDVNVASKMDNFNGTLRTLHIGFASHLMPKIPTLDTLSIDLYSSHNPTITLFLKSHIDQIQNLKLRAWHHEPKILSIITPVIESGSIEILDLDFDMDYILEKNMLDEISMLTDAFLISRIKSLTLHLMPNILHFRNIHHIYRKLSVSLSHMTHLLELTLNFYSINDADLNAIFLDFKLAPKLIALTMNFRATNLWQQLKRIKNILSDHILETLNISCYPPMESNDTSYMLDIYQIVKPQNMILADFYCFNNSDCDILCSTLKQNQNLIFLDLKKASLSPRTLSRILALSASNLTLQGLTLKVKCEALWEIYLMLQQNSRIKFLELIHECRRMPECSWCILNRNRLLKMIFC